jgi:hypothetical protein
VVNQPTVWLLIFLYLEHVFMVRTLLSMAIKSIGSVFGGSPAPSPDTG